jgi:hypothetical protein
MEECMNLGQEEPETIRESDRTLLARLVMDAFRRIIFHYGAWFTEVHHQVGLKNALEVESKVWKASFNNQMTRLAKTLGFKMTDGIPNILLSMEDEQLISLLKSISINWLANDGIWFQGVETQFGMGDAKRCNDTCWSRYSPYEALRIKELLNLPENGGIPALKKALSFRLYAMINEQSFQDDGENAFIFYMNDCRVQSARKRKGLADYPCKSGGMVEYTCFARSIDSRFQTECIGCPPDEHPPEWYCAWRFSLP